MKIEICENTGITTVVCFAIAAAAICVTHGCATTQATKRAAFEAGLEEVQKGGTTETLYQRAKP